MKKIGEFESNTNRGLFKIFAGLALTIGGVFGVVFGRKLKTAIPRTLALVTSLACLATGVYLFADGLDDRAIGRVGAYRVGGSDVQTMYYKSPAFFEAGIALASAHQPDLRRLRFSCPDGSDGFTVYITSVGTFGVPSDNFVCNDGFILVTYDIERLTEEDRELYASPVETR